MSEALLNGWGGPNYIGFNCTYGGANSDGHIYSIRFTFSCASYVSGKVAQIGEISLMGSTNWTMPYNLGARGHMYDWDTSQNVAFPAGVSASWFSGSGSSLTSLNASNLASGTVPIARIPTGTSSSTVALGNHTHSQYAATSHNHSAANITSGTLAAARLPTSGVTAGSYGPTANVTGTNNTTINVPQITVDAYGRVTSVVNRVYTSRDTDTNTTYTLGSFGITATAAELNKLDGVTTTATQFNYLNTLTGNVQTQLNGKAASSHTHSYLPLSGGTLTGRLTANAKISATTAGGSWINGKTVTNAGYCITTQPDSAGNAYYPFFAAKSGSGHTVNLGCLGNAWGFYGFKSSRTDNGTDWQFTFDAGTGAITHNSTMTQTGVYTSKNSLDMNASSSSASYSASFAIQDKNGNQMGDIQCSKQTSNRNAIQIEASRTVSGTSYYNNLRLCISNTGGLSYTISSAAAFRDMLGLGNTSGAVPVANGGTGTTAKGRTLLSNIGITSGTGSAPSSGTNGCIYIQYS